MKKTLSNLFKGTTGAALIIISMIPILIIIPIYVLFGKSKEHVYINMPKRDNY